MWSHHRRIRSEMSKRKRLNKLNKGRKALSNQKKIVSTSNIPNNPTKLSKYSNYKNNNKRKTKDNQKKQLLHFVLAHRFNRQSHKTIKDIPWSKIVIWKKEINLAERWTKQWLLQWASLLLQSLGRRCSDFLKTHKKYLTNLLYLHDDHS